jgi:galactose mutarotase-like enzyme
MMDPDRTIVLNSADNTQALLAPDLGGWLLRYARHFEGRGWEEALYWSQEVVDRYPREMYAGNPVLFPLVSWNSVEEEKHFYQWQGRTREMPQHGFARRLPWQVNCRTPESVTLELKDNEGTRKNYPFSFLHQITYRLRDGRLYWDQLIENCGSGPMPFSAGFHPYLYVPLTDQGRRRESFIRIPDCQKVSPVGSWLGYTREPFSIREWNVNNELEGTLFLTELEKPELCLIDPFRKLEIVLNFEAAPKHRFIALWTRSPESPFYCLEPWTSLPNSFTREADDLILLEPGETFQAGMWLEIRAQGHPEA